jgi:hypothetical protein
MSRPIAYNASGPLSGSIRGGSVNYTVDSGNRDYTTFASKKWVPSADGAAPIVFVTDSYTQGITNQATAVPLFYSCAGTGSAAIIYTANRVPGSPGNYSDANVALNDLITARGYFILESNDPFEGVDADSLTLDVDASKMSSYPQTGTSWFDLSGQGNTAALTNGPVWNSGGWINFDGTDDYAVNSSSTLNITDNVTLNAWIRNNGTGTSVGNYMSKAQNSGYRMRRNGGSGSPFWIYSNGNSVNGGAINDNIWYMVTGVFSSTGLRAYINSTLVASNSAPYSPGALTLDNLYIGAYTVGAEYFGGDIQNAQVYSSALTEAQVKQNYFGSPIVTDGLVFAVDANNIVSYPKSGTSVYNLTGSGTTGTLTNGPTFSPLNGGSISLDGTDDYINGNSNAQVLFNNSQNHSFSLWIKKSGNNSDNYAYIYDKYGTTRIPGLLFVLNSNTLAVEWWAGFWVFLDTGLQVENDIWNFITVTIDAPGVGQTKTAKVYLYKSTGLVTATVSSATDWDASTNGAFNIGRSISNGTTFNGDIAQVLTYNKKLTDAEVQQNYQATQYRFETPAGPVTNGLLLYWDAGNLDSYPGTGTTIYDLSGNGNNGTLVNGVGYNQTNGGVLTFDGVDDYGISYNPNLTTTNNTVMGAARYSGATRGRMINATDNNWLIGCWSNSTENYYALGWVSPVGNGPSDTNWRIVTALGDLSTDSYTSYMNNNLSAGPNGAGSQGPDGISIGAQTFGGTSEFSTGQFSFVLVYNRVLTAAEMTQNYNYFKGRFGL